MRFAEGANSRRNLASVLLLLPLLDMGDFPALLEALTSLDPELQLIVQTSTSSGGPDWPTDGIR